MVTAPRRDSLPARFGPAAMATAVVGLVVTMHPLTPLARGFALACVVASWASPGMLFARHAVRTRASVVAGIAAVTAAGQTQAGVVYGAATGAFLLVCLASMRMARNGAPRAGAPTAPPSPWAVLTLTMTAATVAATLIASLPWLATRVERRITAMLAGAGEEETAFSSNMVLGSTRGMLQSDAIVMRIDGERPEYLRGAVYDRYVPPFWRTSAMGGKVSTTRAEPTGAAERTTLTLARGAPEGDDMRWFLPPNACDIATATGLVEIDRFGIARRSRGKEDPKTITFRTSRCATAPAPVQPPSAEDVEVPLLVATALEPVATAWVQGATTDRAKLEALQRELGRFEYSLAVARDPKLDPVVDFVTVHHAGHCEYFASAMVLMARTQGIPARVVGGYRAAEVNPLTGRTVVRDRNAHAWVEAWVDGAWRSWDPTPASGRPARPGTWGHVGDLVSSAIDRTAALVSRLGPFGTIGVLAAIVATFFALRAVARWAKGARLRRVRASALSLAVPLPCFDSLTDALTSAGLERDPSEPVEVFARRLATFDAPWAGDAARALLLYADLRYGGLGDEAAIVRELDRATRAVRSRR